MSDGKVTIDTTLDSKGITTGLSNLKGAVVTAAKGAAVGLGAITAGAVMAGKALWDSANAIAENGDMIDKASQKLGIGSELFQKLSYACELSGTSIDSLRLGVKVITNDIADMANGVEKAGDKYAQLGISLYDMNGNLKSSEQVLQETLYALADMQDETQRNAIANDIFGRSYQELMPLLNSGAEGIKSMMNEAEAYGMVMSEDAVKASAKFEDSLTKLKGSASGLRNEMLSDLLPAITEITDGFSDLIAGNEDAPEKLANGFVNLGETIIDIVKNVLTSLPALVNTVIQVIIGALNSAGEVIPQFVSIFIELIPQVVEAISTGLPLIAEAGVQLFLSLLEGYKELVPTLLESGPTILSTIVQGIMSSATILLNGFTDVFTYAMEFLPVVLPIILEGITQIMDNAVTVLLENAPALLEASILLFNTLIEALPVVLPLLLEAIPPLINAYIGALAKEAPVVLKGASELFKVMIKALNTVTPLLIKALPLIIDIIIQVLEDNFPLILECAQELFGILVDEIPEIVRLLTQQLPQIVTTIMTNLRPILSKLAELLDTVISDFIAWTVTATAEMVKGAGQLVKEFIDNFTIVSEVKDKLKEVKDKIIEYKDILATKAGELGEKIFNGVKNKIKNLPSEIKAIGNQLVTGLWNGINDKFSWLTTQIKSFAENVKNKLKGFFGIKSPSRVMRDEVGKFLAEGIGVGFIQNNPIDEIKASLKNSMKDLQNQIGLDAQADITTAIQTASPILNFYDTQTTPDAIYQKFYQQQTFGLARQF